MEFLHEKPRSGAQVHEASFGNIKKLPWRDQTKERSPSA